MSAKAPLWEKWQQNVQLESQIKTSTMGFVGSFFFSQTVILISENHKFIHLPFSLEVKCKGFRTEQASTSVTCQRAAEQKHIGIVSNTDIYIYIYKKKNLSYLVTLLLDYSHSLIFSNLHDISMKPAKFD